MIINSLKIIIRRIHSEHFLSASRPFRNTSQFSAMLSDKLLLIPTVMNLYKDNKF